MLNFQRPPERGLCLVTSFAMILDVPVTELLAELGERWKSYAFPNLPQPYCFRGIHIQELVQIALARGYALTPVELMPAVAPPQPINPETQQPYANVLVYHGLTMESNWHIFNRTIMTSTGFIVGNIAPLPTKLIQRGHAVAYDHGTIYDPDGEAYLYSARHCEDRNFYSKCAWRLDKREG